MHQSHSDHTQLQRVPHMPPNRLSNLMNSSKRQLWRPPAAPTPPQQHALEGNFQQDKDLPARLWSFRRCRVHWVQSPAPLRPATPRLLAGISISSPTAATRHPDPLKLLSIEWIGLVCNRWRALWPRNYRQITSIRLPYPNLTCRNSPSYPVSWPRICCTPRTKRRHCSITT
jgi:hypothetical protein